MTQINYKSGYKYQLASLYQIQTNLTPATDINSPSGFIQMTTAGLLTIARHYAWDGPSGPTIDTANFMRGSLVHDAVYQLIREGSLEEHRHRDKADRLLQQICIADGMSRIRAWWVYQGLKIGGGAAADPDNLKQVITAP